MRSAQLSKTKPNAQRQHTSHHHTNHAHLEEGIKLCLQVCLGISRDVVERNL
jgi:hypothetical protein